MKGGDAFFSLAESGSLGAFGLLVAFLLGGAVFVLLGSTVTKILAPHRPNPEKLTTYECGEDPVGDAGVQFHIRFYLVALVFLIFEVEILFLFPWATVFADPEWILADPRWGILAFVEMLIFATILILGLVYVWRRGDLDGTKPSPLISKGESIEQSVYAVVNQKYLPQTVSSLASSQD